MIPVWIGADSREEIAYRVCKRSIERRTSTPVYIRPLRQKALRYVGLYTRGSHLDDGVLVDDIDGKPFSTEFAFTRFLVPALQQYEGWAMFCDCDFLFRRDISDLWDLRDDRYAAMVVKHRHIPRDDTKMDGARQDKYERKNWSSLVLWNCGHEWNKEHLTVDYVNQTDGGRLHAFSWLYNTEHIGSLPHGWNFLEGRECVECAALEDRDIRAVHYTRGGPWFEGWQNVEYAADWEEERRNLAWLRG